MSSTLEARSFLRSVNSVLSSLDEKKKDKSLKPYYPLDFELEFSLLHPNIDLTQPPAFKKKHIQELLINVSKYPLLIPGFISFLARDIQREQLADLLPSDIQSSDENFTILPWGTESYLCTDAEDYLAWSIDTGSASVVGKGVVKRTGRAALLQLETVQGKNGILLENHWYRAKKPMADLILYNTVALKDLENTQWVLSRAVGTSKHRVSARKTLEIAKEFVRNQTGYVRI